MNYQLDVQYLLSHSTTCSPNELATLSPDCPPLKAIAIYQQRGEGRNQASAFYEHIAQMEVVSLRFTYKTYTQYTALFCPVVELMTATYTYTARNGTGKDTN